MKSIIEELKRLHAAATDGEWASGLSLVLVADRNGWGGYEEIGGFKTLLCMEDAAFTAAAHNAIPGLIALVEEMAGTLECVRNGLLWYQAEHPEDESDSDGEMLDEIDAALAKYNGEHK